MAWTEEETIKLIELWGEESVQDQLQICTRNRSVYDKLSRQMTAAGFTRSAVQCREKIKKLRSEYKRVKDNNGLTGRGTRKWRYYDQLDAILGHRPSTEPPIVLDTSADQVQGLQTDGSTTPVAESQFVTEEEYLEESEQIVIEEGGGGKEETESVHSQMTVVDVKGSEEEKENIDPADEEGKKAQTEQKGKKRKRPCRRELIEKTIEGVMTKAAKAQEESDIRFLEIEEKRLKFDELMMEMENKRWKEEREREERQRREEREFQLKVNYWVWAHIHACNSTVMRFLWLVHE